MEFKWTPDLIRELRELSREKWLSMARRRDGLAGGALRAHRAGARREAALLDHAASCLDHLMLISGRREEYEGTREWVIRGCAEMSRDPRDGPPPDVPRPPLPVGMGVPLDHAQAVEFFRLYGGPVVAMKPWAQALRREEVLKFAFGWASYVLSVDRHLCLSAWEAIKREAEQCRSAGNRSTPAS